MHAPSVNRAQRSGGDTTAIRKWSHLLLAALAVGAALGVLSVLGERVPGRALTIVVNLASPWALAALVVGRLAASPRRGALVGGVTLLVAMATFYLLTPFPYVRSARDVVWTLVAVIVGPVMGLCGGLLAADRGQWHTVAVVVPSAMLLAEATWVAIDRRILLSNFQREAYRLIDVAILLAFIALALELPWLLVIERRRLPAIYLAIFVAGLVGASGFEMLQRLLLHV